MRCILRQIFFIVAAFVAATCWPSLVHANMISLFETQFNTDWTTAGIGGMRTQGTGMISLAGVSGTVNQAYLYWHGPTNSADPAENASVLFGGSPVVGTNIGFSQDNFWGFNNSQAYRADVTSLVPGNGAYSLSGFTTSLAEINGVSLVVFFDDGDSTNNRDVVTFDGNDSIFASAFDADGWDATLSGINYNGGAASIVFGVSDGQDFDASDDPSVLLNGSTLIPFGADPFDGDGSGSQDAGSGFPSNGLLWDIKSFDVTSFLSIGPNSLNLTTLPTTGDQDALSLVHLHFDLPAGSAPTGDMVPEPSTLVLWSLGAVALAGLGWRRRRRAA